MSIFKTDKTISRLNQMIDNAIEGKPIENGFDETKTSALETKLSHYLAANSATKAQLAEEKAKINELISDISHQTKTPIANILLYAQILEESVLPEKERQCVQSLVGQAEKLNFLIASLVKTSRLETGIIAVSPKRSDIQSLLDEVMRQALPKAQCKGIALACENREAYAAFDPKWTAEAIYNIVDNAVKYTPQGGSICISVAVYELFARIDIKDTGIGISEEETAKIFTRFYRSPTVGDEEGVGIGLYLARKILSDEGGYLKVQSELGKGSTFSVFLPLES
ncbi:HAMP domain-containing sensor histidine kinase [Hydrogenoanaerobacterium sp.]|uniref:sensor histidine kinase n=1 Tax=Hydrogenoanaerobacterium sp. TaxID=2953763 RepID=UPI00289CC951|nr:HAMP domain-containing sensor histidine kinase [Hydrogenoanaerobacterium sp.]